MRSPVPMALINLSQGQFQMLGNTPGMKGDGHLSASDLGVGGQHLPRDTHVAGFKFCKAPAQK